MEDQGLDFDAWYRELHPRLVTTLIAVLGNVDVACEAADEAFARAYERWTRVSGMESPAASAPSITAAVTAPSARSPTTPSVRVGRADATMA